MLKTADVFWTCFPAKIARGKQSRSWQWLENAIQLNSIEILDSNFVILKMLAIILHHTVIIIYN